MKALKIIMVFITTFCLLNMQYQAGVVHLSMSNDVQAADQVRAQNVYVGEEVSQADGYLDQILYLAVGIISAGLVTNAITCANIPPLDVWAGVTGGVIIIVGELVTMNANKEAVVEARAFYKTDHEDKTYNNEQIEALETQLTMNEELADALETKRNIQIAATVAFGVATGIAIFSAVLGTTLNAIAITENSAIAAVSFGTMAANCATANGELAKMEIQKAIPQLSCSETNQKLIDAKVAEACPGSLTYTLHDTINDAYCSCSVGVLKNSPWNNSLQKYAMQNPAKYEIANHFAKEFQGDGKKDDEESKKEVILNALNNPAMAKPMLTQSHPMHNVFVQQELKIQNELHRYMRVYEKNKFFEGSLKSVSLDDYHKFESIYRYDDLETQDQSSMKDILKMAAFRGMDLIFPTANANFMKLLTVVGSVLVGIWLAQGKILDLISGAAWKRMILWGVITGIIGYSLFKTKKGLKATNSNITELKKILNNMSDLVDGQDYQIGGPVGGGGADDLGTKPVFGDINGNILPLGLGDGNITPCAAGSNPDGTCKSIAAQFNKPSPVEAFKLGGALAGASNLVGAIGDGLSGVGGLTAGTMANIEKLNGQKGAIANNNRLALKQADKLLKKNGRKPFGLNKRVSDFHNKMRATLKSSLKKQGLTPKLAAAKLGLTGSGSDKKVTDAKEKAIQNRKGTPGGKATASKAKSNKIDFGFGASSNTEKAAAANFEEPGAIVENMEEYDVNDISAGQSADIFQIISVRYLKSGYKRLRSDKAQNILNN